MNTQTRTNRFNVTSATTLFAFLLAGLLAGCEGNHYEIELKPDGETLHRSLTTWRQKSQQGQVEITTFPEAELKQIAEAHHQPAPDAAHRKYDFVGDFVGATPNDVGGAGNFTYWKSEMGNVSLYTERFRGNDDLAAALDDRHNATDTLTKLMIGWFQREIGDDPQFNQLKKFIDTDLRRDLRNLSIYFWTAETMEIWRPTENADKKGWDDQGLLVRSARYLMERNYLTPAALPEFVQAFRDEDRERLLKFVRDLAAAKMGIPADAAAKRLTFLSDTERTAVSLKVYLETTDEYKAMLKAKQADDKQNVDESQAEAHELLTELIFRAAGIGFGGGDALQVKLNCTTQPFTTNGTWNEQTKQVVWSKNLPNRHEPPSLVLPTMLYANWSDPNESFQKAHFGRVILNGSQLAEYCLWREAIGNINGKEWDLFLTSLKPADDLLDRLDKFRFADQADTDPDTRKHKASTPRELISAALQGTDTK